MNFNLNCSSDANISKNEYNKPLFSLEPTECNGCLSIWCDSCRIKEMRALELVWQLLVKVDQVHALFPSTKKLTKFFPSWENEEFVMRYKALCLWFNTTTQLRIIIDLLGNRLGQMTEDIPWPKFHKLKFLNQVTHYSSTISRDSGVYSLHNEEHYKKRYPTDNTETNVSETKVEKLSPDSCGADNLPKSDPHSVSADPPSCVAIKTPVVRFEIEDTSSTSDSTGDPSHSSESFTSNSSNYSTKNVEVSHEGFLSPPPPSQGLRRCSSDIFLEANPYR